MYKRMAGAWSGSKRGQVILGVWAVTVAGATVKAVLTRRSKRAAARAAAMIDDANQAAKADDAGGKDAAPDKKTRRLKLRKLISKAMKGKSRTMPWLILLTTGICAKVLVSVQVSRQIGYLGKLVATRDWPAMFRGQINFAAWCIPAAAIGAFTTAAESRLALAFRSNLTDALHDEYQQAQTVLPARRSLDNPDQRVTNDVENLCGTVSELYAGTVRPLMEVALLTGTLANLMGVKELLTSYGCMFALGGWIRWVGPSFTQLTTTVAKEEAAFRSSHKRIVDYAEEIEMLRGANAEVGIVRSDFARVRNVLSSYISQTMISDCLSTYCLRYVTILVAYSTMLPAVYYGSASAIATSGDDPTEYTLTCLHLLVNVGLAGRTLIQSMRKSAVAGALATRVDAVSEVIAAAKANDGAPGQRSTTADHVVEFTGVDLDTPDGKRLVSNLSFRVGRHEHVFLHGPNGAGKTTLFRVMCGIMEPSSGHIALPPRSECFYVPQRSYLIPGSLREQLMYPDTAASATAESSTLDASAERLMEVLERVGLKRLAPTDADLDKPFAWSGLSAGERQRIGIARLLVHQPAFAMLDECTNNLTEAFEAWVYTHCKKLGITLFTVSHRTKLRGYHAFDLHLRGDGSYSFDRLA